MDNLSPVYTEKTSCQDCYKCIRHCPVKAIVMEKGHARVEPESCILCGKCVRVCPVGAKKIRNDVENVANLLYSTLDEARPAPVLSLAPSWPADFPKWTEGNWVWAAQKVGFSYVSETALGAQAVIEFLGKSLVGRKSFTISTACPTVVDYIRKYKPEFIENLAPVYSPLMAHAAGLKERLGKDVPVVFAGPCIAKKGEADTHPERIYSALTFRELRELFERHGIDVERPQVVKGDFFPWKSGTAAAFASDGGLKKAYQSQNPGKNLRIISISGVDQMEKLLTEIEEMDVQNIFLDILACEGGCLQGPGLSNKKQSLINSVVKVENRLTPESKHLGLFGIQADWSSISIPSRTIEDKKVSEVLEQMGKTALKDRLNCAGCGYDSCFDMAKAVAKGRAEQQMCVSYNRKWTQKKLNAVVRTLPLGLVIVDSDLKILEANRAFVEMAGEEVVLLNEANPGLENLELRPLVPFADDFAQVIKTGQDIMEASFTWQNKRIQGTIFQIEHQRAAGGLFQDMTVTWDRRDQVVSRAEQVIRKNVETVQKIAFLLGENAADTEAILNSIMENFGESQ